MRGFIPDYRMRSVASLREAVDVLKAEPGVWRPFAGGTDVMVALEAGMLKHLDFLNLWGLSELKGIREDGEWLRIGALTTYSEIRSSKVLLDGFPNLVQAAAETGAWAIQNRGTLGGNVMNASPAADTVPALMAYDAEAELVSSAGTRWVRLEEFYQGYKKTVARPEEILASLRLPLACRQRHHAYRKVGTRRAQSIAKVGLAASALIEDGGIVLARLALSSVAPITFRPRGVEAALAGQRVSELSQEAKIRVFQDVLEREISPIDDVRSNREYRLSVARGLLKDFLTGLSNESPLPLLRKG